MLYIYMFIFPIADDNSHESRLHQPCIRSFIHSFIPFFYVLHSSPLFIDPLYQVFVNLTLHTSIYIEYIQLHSQVKTVCACTAWFFSFYVFVFVFLSFYSYTSLYRDCAPTKYNKYELIFERTRIVSMFKRSVILCILSASI